MSDSAHPGSDDFGEGGLANGDWWEFINVSDEAIDMTGFSWDDNGRRMDDDFTIFPAFTIQPREVVIVVNEDEPNIDADDGFRVAWSLPSDLRILSKTFFEDTDSETFSRLSSGGDEVNLYDAAGELIQSVEVPPATEGLSSTFGFVDGSYTSLGFAEAGIQGATTAFSDGSGNRLASPILWAEDLANGLIDLDVSSAGRVDGAESAFGGGTPDIDAICAMVAAGTSDASDLAAALEQLQILPGDANLSGNIDFTDFLVLSTNFGTGPQGGQFTSGDFDCDGSVGFTDFLALSTNFGQTFSETTSSTGVSAVPEPHSGLLVWCAFMLGSMIRKRRTAVLV